MADLSVEIAGVRFKNPVWTSSSEVTENFEKMKRAFDMGAGAVVAKSYTNSQEYKRNTNLTKARIFGHDRRPAYGRDIPRIYTNYWRGGIGLEGEEEDFWFEELVKTLKYAKQCDAQVVGSVFGSTDAKEMARLAIKMQQIDIPMIELDLACPQGEELHDKGGIVKSCDTYVDITRTVVQAVKIPVFVKLSPQQQDLAATARAVKAVGAAGVTCHNRFLGFAVDIDNEKPYIWGWAGVGGTWMLPLTLRWVSKIHADDPKFPILGSNGAYDWEDVVRFLMSGASAIEFCSTVIVRGFYVVKEAIEGLNAFLDAKGHKSVREIIGAAVRNSYAYEQMWSLPGYFEKSSIDQDLCIHCGKCYDTCWYHGIVKKDEKAAAPCKEACPAHIDVPQYVRLVGQCKFADALAVVRESIPFPSVCGIACFHPCESKCLRGHLDDPIAIMGLKRFIAEKDNGAWQSETNKYRTTGKKIDITGKKVAILGSGPAGLTAGYYLAEHGHAVTVFEAAPLAGGMMRVAIPEYRLPGSVLDREIEGIKSAGVEIKTNCRVSSLADLPGYDAVFVATGTHGKVKLGIEGEDSPGVLQCLPFLRNVKLGKKVKLGEKVAVIGGGNAAIDAARTASRLGARDVTVIYRRSRAEMPASADEIEQALTEGVGIEFLAAPVKIAKHDGHLDMQCVRMKLGAPDASGRPHPVPVAGSEFNVLANSVIVAVGEAPDAPARFGLKRNGNNTIWVNPETLATSKEGVFAGGDVASGPSSIIEAIAAGRKAAASIDKYLGGKGVIDEVLAPPEGEVKPLDAEKLPEEKRVAPAVAVPLAKRLFGFDLPECVYTADEAMKEAKRCLHCDANWLYDVNVDKCKGCYNCKFVCPVVSCINIKPIDKK